jgi:hypothetical protein
MFPEASTMEVRLSRELAGTVERAAGGEWSARDGQRQLRHFSWRDRVRDRTLATLDTRVFASYGIETQLARLQLALDDVADHIPEDAETLRLRADVVVSRNGHEPFSVTLASHTRQVR